MRKIKDYDLDALLAQIHFLNYSGRQRNIKRSSWQYAVTFPARKGHQEKERRSTSWNENRFNKTAKLIPINLKYTKLYSAQQIYNNYKKQESTPEEQNDEQDTPKKRNHHAQHTSPFIKSMFMVWDTSVSQFGPAVLTLHPIPHPSCPAEDPGWLKTANDRFKKKNKYTPNFRTFPYYISNITFPQSNLFFLRS